MRGARVEIGLRVIVGALVFILDEQRDGCSEGYAMLQTRLEVDKIFFGSLKTTLNTDGVFSQSVITGVVRSDWPGLLRVSWT